MKQKYLILPIVFIGIIFLTGCNEKKETKLETDISSTINIDDKDAKLVCTTDYDYTELKYVIGSKYVVFADDDKKVTKVISEEIIQSNDEDKLNEFEEYLNTNHNAATQYDGYSYKVDRKDNKVISDVTIDYSKFNFKQFAEDNKDSNAMTEAPTLDSIESEYVSLGATCKRK